MGESRLSQMMIIEGTTRIMNAISKLESHYPTDRPKKIRAIVEAQIKIAVDYIPEKEGK